MPYRTKPLLAWAACTTCAVGLACGSTSDPKTATGPGTGGTPTQIAKVSGDSQFSPYDQPIAKPLTVKVTDSVGAIVTSAPVAWAVLLDGAALTQRITFTNPSGETQLSPELVGIPGAFTVNAALVNGQNVTFTGTSDITLASGLATIASGLFASCGLTSQGQAYCWGNGLGGQLGNASAVGPHTGPIPVTGGQTFKQISVSDFDTCGLTTSGTVYCWGDQTNGAFGNGVAPGGPLVLTPVPAANGQTFSSIAVGDGSSCGLASGVVYCWGANNEGQLGTGDTTHHWLPTRLAMPSGVSFASIGSEGSFSCALSTTGVAYCWGNNYSGQLGLGSGAPNYSLTPTAVTGGHTFTSLAVGATGVCGLTSGGAVYCWGEGVGGSGTTTELLVPTQIQQSGLTFTEISAAGQHACGLATSGVAYCWGANYEGSLGSGSFATNIGSTPVAVTGGLTFNTIIAGGSFTCGYTTSNVMYCWGSNDVQQLGLSAAIDSIPADTMFDAPVAIPGMTGAP